MITRTRPGAGEYSAAFAGYVRRIAEDEDIVAVLVAQHDQVLTCHVPLWRETHSAYAQVKVPVLLIYGDHDWSRPAERQATLREIPGARLVTVKNGGHFLPLDQPEAVMREVRAFASELVPQ